MYKNLQVDQLGVVHLEKHTGNLASQLGLHLVDLGVKSLSEHLLLLTSRSGVQSVDVDARSASTLREVGRSLASAAALRCATTGTSTALLGEAVAAADARNTSHLGRHAGHRRHGSTAASTASTHSLLGSLGKLDVLRVVHVGARESARDHTRGHVHGRDLSNVRSTASTLLTGDRTGETSAASALLAGNRTGERLSTSRREHHGLLTGCHEHGLHATELLLLLLLHAKLVAGLDGSLQLVLADILALSQGDVEGLATDHLLVHLGDGLGGLIGVAEADETEALALAEDLLLTLDGDLLGLLALLGLVTRSLLLLLFVLLLFFFLLLRLLLGAFGRKGVAHDLSGGDGAKGCEHIAKLVVINIVIKVLDVQVDTLVLGLLLETGSLVLLAQLLLTLVLLLGAADVQLLAVEVGVVQLIDSLGGSLVLDVVDKAKAAALALLVAGEGSGGDLTVLLEELTELLIGNILVDVLDVDVGEVGLHLLELAHALLLGDVVADEDLLLVKQHAVDVLDGAVSSLGSLVVDESVALGVAGLILCNLAAQNVAEGSKGVVQSLIVDGVVKVLDEDIALASLAQSRVALRPHDTARLALDDGVVKLLKSLLAVLRAVVVNIGVSERAAGDGVAADTDRCDLADGREELEQHGFGNGGVKLSYVERGRVGVGSCRGRSGGRDGIVGGGNVGVDRGAVGSIRGTLLDRRSRVGGFGRHVDYLAAL